MVEIDRLRDELGSSRDQCGGAVDQSRRAPADTFSADHPNADQRSTRFGRLVVEGRRAALPDALAEQVPWDVEKDEAAAFLGMGLKIGLDKNLDGFVVGVNFDPDRCIAEIDFVPTTILSPAEPQAAPMGCRRSRQRASPDCAPDDRMRRRRAFLPARPKKSCIGEPPVRP
jgi:hypothetical protein